MRPCGVGKPLNQKFCDLLAVWFRAQECCGPVRRGGVCLSEEAVQAPLLLVGIDPVQAWVAEPSTEEKVVFMVAEVDGFSGLAVPTQTPYCSVGHGWEGQNVAGCR